MRTTLMAAVLLATACTAQRPEPHEHEIKETAATKDVVTHEELEELCTTDDVEAPSALFRWEEPTDGLLSFHLINPSDKPATMRVKATLGRTKVLLDKTLPINGDDDRRLDLSLREHLEALGKAEFAEQIWVTADVTIDDRFLGTASASPRFAIVESGRLSIVDVDTLRAKYRGGDLTGRFFADVEPHEIGGASAAFVATKADLVGDPTDSAIYEAEVVR
ncbi:MAG: hypothetical protein RIT81_06590 [Deltaproteobacteria bacterium]